MTKTNLEQFAVTKRQKQCIPTYNNNNNNEQMQIGVD